MFKLTNRISWLGKGARGGGGAGCIGQKRMLPFYYYVDFMSIREMQTNHFEVASSLL